MNSILIVGCGYVGSELAKRYLEQGIKVWVLQRHPVEIAGVENIIADISKPLQIELPRVDTVFYLVSADTHTQKAYHQAYVDGIAHLLLAFKFHSPKIIYASSTAVYSQQTGEWVDESSLTKPLNFSGQVLLEGEKLVQAHSSSHHVVRFGGIYGPGREKILRDVLQQKAQRVTRPLYTNRIHQQDCAAILQHLAKLSHALPTVLAVDNEPILYNEILCWLAAALNVPMPAIGDHIPERLLNSNKRCSNKLLLSTGYTFQYPTFRHGYQVLIEELNEKSSNN